MGTATGLINQAIKDLGKGGQTPAHRWYGARNGSYFALASTPECNMSVTYWAYHSDNYAAVCFGTDYAYTVYHAQRFQKEGRWTYGTSGIRKGDIIFFQWEGGSRSISKIDHVGIVVSTDSNYVYTIEANTGGTTARKTRARNNLICGYGRPAFGTAESATPAAEEKKKEAMPDFTWYSKSKNQTIKPGSWTTVNFDLHGPGSKKGDYWSVVFGPRVFSSTFSFTMTGLDEGTEVQARMCWYKKSGNDWVKSFDHPIDSYVHKGGSGHFTYSIDENITKDLRARVQVVQYGNKNAVVESAKITTHSWKV